MPQALSFVMTSAGVNYQGQGNALGVVTVLKDATANNDFTIDVRNVKGATGNLRGKELRIVPNQSWTSTPVVTGVQVSNDNVNYETLKKFSDDAALAAVPSVIAGNDSVYIIAHDFNFLKINTTGGKTTATFDGFVITINS